MTQPSVGRIVHYASPDGDGQLHCLAAIVTEADADKLGLTIFAPANIRQLRGVPSSGEPAADCWHWPERT